MNDERKYIIAKSEKIKIWNNGEIFDRNMSLNGTQSYSDRMFFLDKWKNCKIGKFYKLRNWSRINIEKTICFSLINPPDEDYFFDNRFNLKFLGFKEEFCSSCKIGFISWVDQFLICENCNEISGVEIED